MGLLVSGLIISVFFLIFDIVSSIKTYGNIYWPMTVPMTILKAFFVLIFILLIKKESRIIRLNEINNIDNTINTTLELKKIAQPETIRSILKKRRTWQQYFISAELLVLYFVLLAILFRFFKIDSSGGDFQKIYKYLFLIFGYSSLLFSDFITDLRNTTEEIIFSKHYAEALKLFIKRFFSFLYITSIIVALATILFLPILPPIFILSYWFTMILGLLGATLIVLLIISITTKLFITFNQQMIVFGGVITISLLLYYLAFPNLLTTYKCKASDASCYAIIALEKNDPNICNKFSYPGSCFNSMAIISNDISYCDKIKGTKGISWQQCINEIRIRINQCKAFMERQQIGHGGVLAPSYSRDCEKILLNKIPDNFIY